MRSVETLRGHSPVRSCTAASVARKRSATVSSPGQPSPTAHADTAAVNGRGQPKGESIPTTRASARRSSSASSSRPARRSSTTARPPSTASRHAAVPAGWEARSMPR